MLGAFCDDVFVSVLHCKLHYDFMHVHMFQIYFDSLS